MLKVLDLKYVLKTLANLTNSSYFFCSLYQFILSLFLISHPIRRPQSSPQFKGVSCFYECFQGKQLQQGFNSLQKLRKSVSGALGAALGSRRFDLEHEPTLEEPEQNWFLTKSAPNSLSNPMLYHQQLRTKVADDVGKEETLSLDKVE